MARFKAGDDREKPAHEVTLTRPYYLGKFEVTQEQYQQVMGGNPSDFKGQNLPVENVSCGDAQEFCKKASERAGVVVRLPTEAEWEYTCRAGTRTNYYTGDSDADLERAAWHHWNSDGKIHPVGQKSPNPWGLYDMHGNVWEWCADQYGDYTGRKEAGPQDPAQGQSRVVRGGSSEELTGACRSAARTERMPNARSRFLGFRVAAEVPSRAP
jgi:formylglycine-generating enzyme required for sulfatase activity